MSEQTKQWDLNAYLMAFRDQDGNGFPVGDSGYKSSFPRADRITCVDGFSLSVQATHGAYCSPRTNLGPWYEVEVGFPSAYPDFIMSHAEEPDKPTETVYPYTPIELVDQFIAMHGGPDEATRAKLSGATS